MAPVQIDAAFSYTPLIVSSVHVSTVAYLIYSVGSSLCRSYRALTPSQGTRTRLHQRTRLVPLFASLAFLGLTVAVYSSASHASLSYRKWADDHGIALPAGLFGPRVQQPEGISTTNLYLAHWLSDTTVYKDAFELLAEKARRFWWAQQIDLGLVAFGSFLALEGRRRNIQSLSSFLLLAHLVNLSFAQNVFYLALLLTPAPLPPRDLSSGITKRFLRAREALLPRKPSDWAPSSRVTLPLLLINLAAIYAVPHAAGKPSFLTVMSFARVATFGPLAVPAIVPTSWGSIESGTHLSPSHSLLIFKTLGLISLAMHVKATLVGLFCNVPESHYHRHSIPIPFDTAERSKWEQSATAIGKVLGSTRDHPVVWAVGRDVLLCVLSMGLWAATRAINTETVLSSISPLAGDPAMRDGQTKDESPYQSATVGNDDILISEGVEVATTSKRQARPRKSINNPYDRGYDDTLSTSLRRRGRPRKAKGDPEEVPGDTTYVPDPGEQRSAAEGDELPKEELDWESAALAWGLSAVGGLGFGSSGVFGAECQIRD